MKQGRRVKDGKECLANRERKDVGSKVETSRWIQNRNEMYQRKKVSVTNNALFTICHVADVLGIKASVHMKEAASL